MRVAAAVAEKGGDLPLSLILAQALGEPRWDRWSAQRDPAYLATAYPDRYLDQIGRASRQRELPPSLLYAVMRRESLLYPAALSASNAWGLFQFLPTTFENMRSKGMLPADLSGPFHQAILDPETSIRIAAVWFEDLLVRQRRLSARTGDDSGYEVLYAVMEHNAGYGTVKRWRGRFGDLAGDVEFVVDNLTSAQTRVFSRHVLADMSLIMASGALAEAAATGPQRSLR